MLIADNPLSRGISLPQEVSSHWQVSPLSRAYVFYLKGTLLLPGLSPSTPIYVNFVLENWHMTYDSEREWWGQGERKHLAHVTEIYGPH